MVFKSAQPKVSQDELLISDNSNDLGEFQLVQITWGLPSATNILTETAHQVICWFITQKLKQSSGAYGQQESIAKGKPFSLQ